MINNQEGILLIEHKKHIYIREDLYNKLSKDTKTNLNKDCIIYNNLTIKNNAKQGNNIVYVLNKNYKYII